MSTQTAHKSQKDERDFKNPQNPLKYELGYFISTAISTTNSVNCNVFNNTCLLCVTS